jgi:hypothetical protein
MKFLIPITLALITTRSALAWGEPHLAITKAAIEVLPDSDKPALGEEWQALGANYCLIPDHVFSDKPNAKFATMDIHPSEVYLKRLHLPLPDQADNLVTVRCFVSKIMAALKARNAGDAARYMGTLCHVIEDFGSPSHTVPGDNMFTLMQQFLPPSELMKDKLMHGPIENGTFEVSIKGYQPQSLGTSVEEISWRLLHRIHEGIINARSTTLPIIQAIYVGDAESVTRHQLKAAEFDAKIVADALHSLIAPVSSPKTALLGDLWPLEAIHLFYPQTEFFGAPFWGHARAGVVMENGDKAQPLQLKVEGGEAKTFSTGISTGMGKPVTWLLPSGVFQRLTVRIGLQAGIGEKGRVEFVISADGKALSTTILNGSDPSQLLDLKLEGVTKLQFSTNSKGLNAKSNYAVWAEPTLHKVD